MKKTDIAYYAGIFDGEGCIIIHRHNTLLKSGKTSIGHYVDLCVGSKDEWLVRQLQFTFGGKVHWRKDEIWDWRISSKQALNCLEVLLPYLNLKRPQAEIAVAFEKRRLRRGRKILSEEDLAIREADKLLISNFNKRKSPGPILSKAPTNGTTGTGG